VGDTWGERSSRPGGRTRLAGEADGVQPSRWGGQSAFCPRLQGAVSWRGCWLTFGGWAQGTAQGLEGKVRFATPFGGKTCIRTLRGDSGLAGHALGKQQPREKPHAPQGCSPTGCSGPRCHRKGAGGHDVELRFLGRTKQGGRNRRDTTVPRGHNSGGTGETTMEANECLYSLCITNDRNSQPVASPRLLWATTWTADFSRSISEKNVWLGADCGYGPFSYSRTQGAKEPAPGHGGIGGLLWCPVRMWGKWEKQPGAGVPALRPGLNTDLKGGGPGGGLRGAVRNPCLDPFGRGSAPRLDALDRRAWARPNLTPGPLLAQGGGWGMSGNYVGLGRVNPSGTC